MFVHFISIDLRACVRSGGGGGGVQLLCIEALQKSYMRWCIAVAGKVAQQDIGNCRVLCRVHAFARSRSFLPPRRHVSSARALAQSLLTIAPSRSSSLTVARFARFFSLSLVFAHSRLFSACSRSF